MARHPVAYPSPEALLSFPFGEEGPNDLDELLVAVSPTSLVVGAFLNSPSVFLRSGVRFRYRVFESFVHLVSELK